MRARRKTQSVNIGSVSVGGDNPLTIQSMTNTDTRDAQATLGQIRALATAGCDIVRVAVPDQEAVKALAEIVAGSPLPVVADIHFDYRLALGAIAAGVAKLRINPGNIGGADKVKAVVTAAAEKGIPIRIGVNAGSLEADILAKYGGVTPAAMVESAARHIALLEAEDFTNIVVSMKASDVVLTTEAYELFGETYDYPLHLGITEAGLPQASAIKSAAGLGHLLLMGIGDTLRVSVTGDPVEEIAIARDILAAVDRLPAAKRGVEVIACPTCGRTQIDLIGIAEAVSAAVKDIPKDLKVAVMGCIVNGPGEGRAADIGIAGGQGKAVIFKNGETLRTVSEAEVVDALLAEIEKM